MIKRYTDHSANERTWLAWIRTAIAIMAFGFLVEKFDLYLAYMSEETHSAVAFQPSLSTAIVGIGLFMVGVLIIISATLRFFIYKQAIESDDSIPYSVKRSNLLLSALMILIAVFLVVYMGHQYVALVSR